MTDKKSPDQRTLEELRRSEERFRVLTSIATEGVMIHENFVILDANQAFVDIVGLSSPQDLIGRNGMEVIRFTPESRQSLQEHIRSNSTQSYDIEIIRPDGTAVPAETHGRDIEYLGRQARLVYMQDISERKLAEDALASEKRFAEALFESLPGVAYAYNEDGYLVRWNRNFEVTLNRKAEELAGGTFHILEAICEEDRPQISQMVSEIYEHGYGEAEFGALTSDGRVIPYFATGRLTELGGKQYLVGVGFDITDRLKSEAEKSELQEQLQHSLKMEAVGQLAGGIAHDFNNLLTAISGNIELAQMDAGPADPRLPYLEQVGQAADSAAKLTRQLLAFSRRQIIEPQHLNLNDLVASVQKLLDRLIAANIEIRTALAKDLGTVHVDRSQVEQILVNLILNAQDAMPDGGELLIETANIDIAEKDGVSPSGLKPGPYVQLTVTDSGHGMTDEVKQRMFEPFFTTKEKGRGTGLGLATIFGSVKQAGGAIDAQSRVDHGSTFRIYLPRLDDQLAALIEDEPDGETPRGNETVLLVEDDPSVIEFASILLQKLGYSVFQAASGEEALELATNLTCPVDLLLTDMVMPGLSGRETAGMLTTRLPNLKVLYMSGYSDELIRSRNPATENLDFIAKPFSMKSLAYKLREVLGPSSC